MGAGRSGTVYSWHYLPFISLHQSLPHLLPSALQLLPFLLVMTQATQQGKKPFFRFSYKEAFKHLGITELQRWAIAGNLSRLVISFDND
jgi:hypothetical protein